MTLAVDETLTINFKYGQVKDDDTGGSGMTENKVRFLWESLAIARKALEEAVRVVSGLLLSAAKPTDAIKDYVHDSLVYHYGLDKLVDRKNCSAWQNDLQQIQRILELSKQYLCANPVTVGDALSRRSRGCFYTFREAMSNRQDDVKVTPSTMAYVNLKKEAWGKIDKDPALFDKWKAGEHVFGVEQFGNIKLDFRELAAKYTRLLIAKELIHEATHKTGGTVDHRYAGPLYDDLSFTKTQRLNNADSHAWAAVSLYKETLIERNSDIASKQKTGLNPET